MSACTRGRRARATGRARARRPARQAAETGFDSCSNRMPRPAGIIDAMQVPVVSAVLALAAAAAACTPALDWREVRPEGAGLVALFPCKPDRQVRRLPLAGTVVEMSLWACSAAGATYAVAFADVGEPERVARALDELAASAARNIGCGGIASQRAVARRGHDAQPAGAAPDIQRAIGRWSAGRTRQWRSSRAARGSTRRRSSARARTPRRSRRTSAHCACRRDVPRHQRCRPRRPAREPLS